MSVASPLRNRAMERNYAHKIFYPWLCFGYWCFFIPVIVEHAEYYRSILNRDSKVVS